MFCFVNVAERFELDEESSSVDDEYPAAKVINVRLEDRCRSEQH